MFRPNTTVTADLNEFPALGTPPAMNRAVPPALNNRLGGGSYATTANNSGGFPNAADSSNSLLDNMNGFQQQQQQRFNGAEGLLPRQQQQPRSFSMDEFPALRSSASPFDNNNAIGGGGNSLQVQNGVVGGKPEQWLDYANLREGQQQQQGKPFSSSSERNDLSDSWTQKQPGQPPQQQQQQQQRGKQPQQDDLTTSSDGKPTDPYGLLGLLGVIRMTDPDRSMLALGSDLTTLGLDLNTADSIYSTFISPWSDTQTLPGLNVEPGYYLPACYRNVQATPPAHQRMRTFSDEILFYVFYCMPKDIAQEAAAQVLYDRNWRYHKELGLWLTKETDENGRPVQQGQFRRNTTMDRGVYVFFDPTTWQKVKREWTLSWDAIEERPATGASLPGVVPSPASTNVVNNANNSSNSMNANSNRVMM